MKNSRGLKSQKKNTKNPKTNTIKIMSVKIAIKKIKRQQQILNLKVKLKIIKTLIK
jgi:hypothetical protein